MKKGFYLMIFLTLCLIVPAVNASLNILPSDYNWQSDIIGIDNNYHGQNVSYGNYPNLNLIGGSNDRIYCEQSTYNRLNSITTESYTVTLYRLVIIDSEKLIQFNYHVNCIGGLEPTPEPNTPRLEATLINSTNTGSTYEIQALPETIRFSQITTTRPGTLFGPEWGTYTPITYTIPAGQTQTFYVRYNEIAGAPVTVVTIVLSLDITAPSNENIINQTNPEIQPNNTAYNPPPIPQVTPGSNDNPINSGRFKPSNNNFVTPFTEFIENVRTFTRLPTMTEPQILKNEVLNGTGNITAPLYNTIDGFSNLLIFPAVTASNNIQLLLNPLEEMIKYCDDVMIEIFKTVNKFFETIYPLRDFFYMLIPDFVWWIMAALLVFEIVVTIMTFVYGRGVTWYYLFGFGEHDKK